MNPIKRETSMMGFYSKEEDFCNAILNSDKAIRFVCLATINGEIRCLKYRREVIPLLKEEDLQLSIMQSLIRASTRETLRGSLGKPVYSYTLYEKVQRITMPLGEDGKLFLMFSLDISEDYQPIISKVSSVIKKFNTHINID